jgi:hypothetical protein
MSGTYFDDTSFGKTKILTGDYESTGVVLAASNGMASDHKLTLPRTLPVPMAGYSNFLSFSTDGQMSWLPIQNFSGQANRNIVSDGTSLKFADVVDPLGLVGLGGDRTSNVGGTQYVILGVAGMYRLQFTGSINPAALPGLSAVNSSETVVGNQPASLAVATTVKSNDTLSFAWTPDAVHAKLVLGAFSDAAGIPAVGLVRSVSPIPDLAVTSVRMAHDAVDHRIFSSGTANTLSLVFNRNLDGAYTAPIVSTGGNGTTSGVSYGVPTNTLSLTWTPSSASAAAGLTVSSVRDSYGIVYNHVKLNSLVTVNPLPAPTTRGRDSAGIKRVYLLTSQPSNTVILGFARAVKRVSAFSSTALPAGASFVPVADITVAPAAPEFTASISTGTSTGTAVFSLSVVDTNDLPYVFTGIFLDVRDRLAAVGFTTSVNTRSFAYTDVHMNFNRDLVDGLTGSTGLSVTGSTGTVAGFSTTAGDFKMNYTTPTSTTDTLVFTGVKDHVDNDPESVSFAVVGLSTSPVFASWVVKPASFAQDYAGTFRLVARFSVALDATTPVSGIVVTGGGGTNQPTNIARASAATDVSFNWNATGYSTGETLSFNFQNVRAADGALDPSETATTVLVRSPQFSSWWAQPLRNGVNSNVEIQFGASDDRLTLRNLVSSPEGAPPMTVTASNGTAPVGISVNESRLFFTHTPETASSVSYTLNNLHFGDNSRIQSLVVVNGPLLSAFNTAHAPDTSNYVLVDRVVTYKASFSKALLGGVTCSPNGTGSSVHSSTVSSNNLEFNMLAKSDTTILEFRDIVGADSSRSVNIPKTVVPVAASLFVRMELAGAGGVAFTNFKVGETYSLHAVFSKPMDTAIAPELAVSGGAVPTVSDAPQWFSPTKLKITWTPNPANAATPASITFRGLRDAYGFVYTDSNNISTHGAALPVTFTAPTISSLVVEGLSTIGSKLKHNVATSVLFAFNRPVSNQPTATLTSGGGAVTYVSGQGTASLLYTITASTLGATSVAFGNVVTTEGGSGVPPAQNLTVVAPITAIARIATQASPAVPLADLVAGSSAALCVVYDQPVSSVVTGVGVSASAGPAPTGLAYLAASDPAGYSFSWTPLATGTTTLTTTNVRDAHGFVYSSLSRDVAVISGTNTPAFILSSIRFVIPQTWNETNIVAWGVEGNNADGTWTRLSVSTDSLAVGEFVQSNTNTKPYTRYRIFTSFSSASAPTSATMRIKALKLYDHDGLIPGTSFTNNSSSTSGYFLQYAEYSDKEGTLNRRYIPVAGAIPKLNNDDGLVSPHELWGSNSNTGLCMTLEITRLSFGADPAVSPSGLVSWWDMSTAARVTLSGLYITNIADRYGNFPLTTSVLYATHGSGLANGNLRYYTDESLTSVVSNNALKSRSDVTVYTDLTYFVSLRPTNASNFNPATGLSGSGQPDVTGRFYYSGGNIYGNTHSASQTIHTIDTTKWYILSLEVTNGGLNLRSRIWNHATDSAWKVGGGTATYPLQNFLLGRQSHIGEVVLYNKVLGDADAQAVAAYLETKWLNPLPDPQFWLDASQRSTLTLTGSNVGVWRTVGGLTPSSHLHATTAPSLVPASMNGLDTINFNNSNAAAIANRWRYPVSFGPAYSLFAVVKIHNASGGYRGGLMFTADNFDHSLGDYQSGSKATTSTIKINTIDNSGNSRSAPINLGDPPTGWFLVEMRVGGSDPFVRAAGSDKRALTSWAVAQDHINVGSALLDNHATDFSLAELRVYSGAYSDVVHRTISNALTVKWGLYPVVLPPPPQPVLQSISVASFTTNAEVTGIVATFDRDVLSVASLTVVSGGTATVTDISGSRVTFTMTATTAANPGSLNFDGVVSTQNSTPVNRSWQITVTTPALTWMTRFTGDVGVVASGGIVSSWTATGTNTTTLQALGASDSVLSYNGRSVVKLQSTSTYFNVPVPFNHAIVFAYFLPADFAISPDPILFVFDQSSDKRNGSVNVDESFRAYKTSGRNSISIALDSGTGAVWSTSAGIIAYNSGTWHSLIVSRGTETGVYLDGAMIAKATRGTPQPLYDGRLMTLSAQHASRSANIAILEHGVLAGAVDDAGAAGIHQELVAYWGAQ